MKITKRFPIATLRAGKEDYNKSITVSVAPFVRVYQTFTVAHNSITYTDLTPGTIVLHLFPLSEYLGVLQTFSNITVNLSKIYLFRVYFGVMDVYKFLTETLASTESDILYATVFGPFAEHLTYGEARIDLNAPVSYITNNPWDYFYVVIYPYLEQTDDLRVTTNVFILRDKYV